MKKSPRVRNMQFLHCSCPNCACVASSPPKKVAYVFRTEKKLRVPTLHQRITKPYAGTHKVPYCNSKAASPSAVLLPS